MCTDSPPRGPWLRYWLWQRVLRISENPPRGILSSWQVRKLPLATVSPPHLYMGWSLFPSTDLPVLGDVDYMNGNRWGWNAIHTLSSCLTLDKVKWSEVRVAQLCLTLCDPIQSLWLYSPWNSPGQNSGVGSLSLLQGIFPTRGSNPGLPHCRWILYQLSHKGE